MKEELKTNRRGRTPFRLTAILTGSLFIIATITAIASMLNLGSLLESTELLSNIPANESRIVISVILELILAVSVMGIGFLMYPVLRKDSEGLAVGYVVFRLVESVLIVAASVCLLSLFTASQEYSAGNWDPANFEPLGILLISIREWSFNVGTLIFLGLGGLFLNFGLFRLRLIPGWLSAWGFIGAGLVVIYGLISLFGHDPSFLAILIAFQEMVFAVWIIIKGFNISKTDAKVMS